MQTPSIEDLALLDRALAEAPARRAALLEQTCRGDQPRRLRIEHLLSLAQLEGGFLERSPLPALLDPDLPQRSKAPARAIGVYRLLRRLGSGGSADVWLADRTEGGFEQHAAVKIIRDTRASVSERFALERGILASLAHPGIARLYDGGVTADGCAYMVMEYVEGVDLVAYAAANALALPERLRLFLQVCDAVAFAHTRLIIHRDIKPANILVGADGQAKLLDFGIAKLLDVKQTGESTHTLHFSADYAAPEQLTGGYVTTSTDVYALGVTLFELLTGRRPWSDEATSMATAVRRLADTPPPVPSAVKTAGIGIAGSLLRGDLDAIVARSMRKQAADRYPDARALADDIRRHLDHQPVKARAGARAYVMRRFIRRQWVGLSVASLAFLGMATALLAIAVQVRHANREAQRAADVQAFMVDLFRHNSGQQADPVTARQTTARELLDRGVLKIESGLHDAPENKLALLRLFGTLYGELALPANQLPIGKQAVALSRVLHGQNSPELARDLIALAKLTADHDDAMKMLHEAGSILDRNHDTRSFLRGQLLEVSVLTDDTTDLPQARAQADQAVSILDAFPQSPELAEALFLQGRAYTYSGSFEAALAPLRRAISVSIATQGVPNPSLSGYYQQLTETESSALQYAAAIASGRRAIEQARAYKGESNFDLVLSEASLAVALINADMPRDSLEFALRAKDDAPVGSLEPNAVYLTTYTLDTSSRALVRAGDPAAGLSDAIAAIKLARGFDPEGTVLASALQRQAEALVELGRFDEAAPVLAEVIALLKDVGRRSSEFNSMLQIRIALGQGRPADGRKAFADLDPVKSDSRTAFVTLLRRDLAEAAIDLEENHALQSVRLAADVVARAGASELAPYLRSTVSEGKLIEGRARLRLGDAASAQALLADALSERIALYLSQSPKIAEAQVALAACKETSGGRDDAARLTPREKTIGGQHGSLSPRYRTR